MDTPKQNPLAELKNGFNVVRSAEQWEEYKKLFNDTRGWLPTQVQWGPGPEWYPALVCTYVPMPHRCVSAIVYPRQARELLDALSECEPSSDRVDRLNQTISRVYAEVKELIGVTMLSQVLGIAIADSQAALEQLHRWNKVTTVDGGRHWRRLNQLDESPWPTQQIESMSPAEQKKSKTVKDYSLRLNANLMTIVQILERAKLTDRPGYERMLAANQAVIDQWAESDSRSLLESTAAAAVIDNLTDRAGNTET